MPRGVKGSGKTKKAKTKGAKKAARAVTKPAVRQQYGSVPATVLINLLNGHAAAKRKTMNISTEIGKQIAAAVETKYLNRKVFAALTRIWKLEPAELRDWLDVWEDCLDKSGLKARAESAPPLMAADDHPDADVDTGNEVAEAFPEEQHAVAAE